MTQRHTFSRLADAEVGGAELVEIARQYGLEVTAARCGEDRWRLTYETPGRAVKIIVGDAGAAAEAPGLEHALARFVNLWLCKLGVGAVSVRALQAVFGDLYDAAILAPSPAAEQLIGLVSDLRPLAGGWRPQRMPVERPGSGWGGFARRWGVEIGACRLFEMEPGERAESPRLTEGSRVELREAFGDAGRPPFPPGRWTASTTLRADINWDWALAAGGSVGGWAIVERIMRASDWLLLLAATPSPWVCDRARVTLLYSCARAMALSARLLGHPGEVERGLIRAEPALSWGWLTAEGRVVVDWCDGPGGPLASRLTAGQARAIAAAAGTDPETAIQPLRRRIGPDGEQMLVDGAGAVVASVRLVEGRAVMRGAR